jgi:hypothetical protein
VCKIIHPMLESSNPFHCALSLVNPITDVPLQRSIPVRVPRRGGASSSEARLGVTVRGVVTTTHMVTRVATPTPYPVSHWGSKCGRPAGRPLCPFDLWFGPMWSTCHKHSCSDTIFGGVPNVLVICLNAPIWRLCS